MLFKDAVCFKYNMIDYSTNRFWHFIISLSEMSIARWSYLRAINYYSTKIKDNSTTLHLTVREVSLIQSFDVPAISAIFQFSRVKSTVSTPLPFRFDAVIGMLIHCCFKLSETGKGTFHSAMRMLFSYVQNAAMQPRAYEILAALQRY